MKQLPIVRKGEEFSTCGPCRKGARVLVTSKVPRTVPRYPVAADDFVLQDPQGFPILDMDSLQIYDNVTNA